MNVLVIAPHPDDESIGPGGAIRLRVKRGDRVVIVFLTSGEQGLRGLSTQAAWDIREAEARAACRVLGVAEYSFLRLPDWTLEQHVSDGADQLRSVFERERPHEVFVPHADEWHPDHRAACAMACAAVRAIDADTGTSRPLLFGYEVWTPLGMFGHAEDVTDVMPDKLAAIRCHQSQLAGFRYDQAARGLARYRGALAAKSRFAEVFSHIDVHG